MELAQRITYQRELVGRWLELVAVSTGKRRPGLGSGRDTLAGLRQHSRIKPTKSPGFVIDGSGAIQTKGLAHRSQTREVHSFRRLGLRAEEQQVLHQTVCHTCIPARQGGVLDQDAGSNPLGIHIGDDQSAAEALEETCTDLPESAYLPIRLTGCNTQGQLAQITRGLGFSILDNAQHRLVQTRTRRRPIGDGCRRQGNVRLPKPTLHGPEIGRVNALHTRKGLDIAILRKQSHRRYRLARQHALQKFAQRETGALDGA